MTAAGMQSVKVYAHVTSSSHKQGKLKGHTPCIVDINF
jgi:hypothetical protein